MFTEVMLPKGTTASKEMGWLTVKGRKGEIKRNFSKPGISLEVNGESIKFEAKKEDRRAKRMLNTFTAHARNMVEGVQNGYVYKLKVIHTHFPISTKVSGNWLVIENIFGEKKPRKARIMENTQVTIKEDKITVTGIDKEMAGQTAANIENATKRPRYDKRIFQDGIYITEKAERGEE